VPNAGDDPFPVQGELDPQQDQRYSAVWAQTLLISSGRLLKMAGLPDMFACGSQIGLFSANILVTFLPLSGFSPSAVAVR